MNAPRKQGLVGAIVPGIAAIGLAAEGGSGLARPASTMAWPIGGVQVCAAPGEQVVEAIIRDGSGGAFLAWQGDSTPVVHHVLSTGQVDPFWPENGLAVSDGTGPRLVPDGTGGVLVGAYVNNDCDPCEGVICDLGMARDQRIESGPGCGQRMFAGRILASSNLDWTGYLSGGISQTTFVPDGSGGAFIGGVEKWCCGLPEWSIPPFSNLTVSRLGPSGSIIWGAPVGADGLEHTFPHSITADGVGGCFVTWQQSNDEIRLERIAPPVSWSLAMVRFPFVVADGSGGAILVWRDLSTLTDVHAHHVLANGSFDPAWPAGGLLLSSVTELSTVVSDGSGGAIIGWTQGSAAQVFVQRVLSSGSLAPGWATGGIPVTDPAANASGLALVADGSGGLIATWVEGGSAIYAQHVLGSGIKDPAWASRGNLVCGGPGGRTAPLLTSDGAGGAIAAWSDARTGDQDVHAQHIPVTGSIVGVGPPGNAERVLALGPPHPNPMKAETRFEFDLASGTRVEIEVFDLLGRRVRTLARGWRDSGRHSVQWDGRDDHGTPVSPGTYQIRARALERADSRTVVVLHAR